MSGDVVLPALNSSLPPAPSLRFSPIQHIPSFRPFLSANLNGNPRASCSTAMSSNVFPWEAAAFRIFRVRASHIR